MFTVRKRIEISGAHSLALPYESPCQNLHGHNWIITVTCRAEELSNWGMVTDFRQIGEIVKRLDHANINEIMGTKHNPTAENIARWLCEQIPCCVKVEVQESEGNVAIYEL